MADSDNVAEEQLDKIIGEIDLRVEEERLAREEEAKAKLKPTRKKRGLSSQRLIEKGQLSLFQGEKEGRFTSQAIKPGGETPTIFTRVPIFTPVKRGAMPPTVFDQDGAYVFETGHGRGRKFGAQLSIFDEDTLLALLGLRQLQLRGQPGKLPVPLQDPIQRWSETDDSNVQVLFTTITDIQRFLGKSNDGKSRKAREESLKRLASVSLEFTKISDNVSSLIKSATFTTKIVDILHESMEEDTVLYVQFPPVMVHWLQESYTYQDMKVRDGISGDVGKAIYRFLASQKHINIGVEKLQTITGSLLRRGRFNEELRKTIKHLESIGWCRAKVIGNGRSEPQKLVGRRLSKIEADVFSDIDEIGELIVTRLMKEESTFERTEDLKKSLASNLSDAAFFKSLEGALHALEKRGLCKFVLAGEPPEMHLSVERLKNLK
ncbi:MAG: hypothetical protein GKR90_25620 [Pseudomonadales bacterium]|nr:hypothetical protein [Pseudomonadales bacterium]